MLGPEVDRCGLRRRARRPDADGQARRTSGRTATSRPRFKDAALVIDRTWVGQNTSHQVLEPRSAMAYWQNGKLYPPRRHAEHGADRAERRALGRHRGQGHRAHQRVHRRRLRQPHPGLHRDGHSGAAVEEGQRAGHDAHHARGRALHRPRPAGRALAHQGRLRQGRARCSAVDLFIVTENGPFDQVGDGRSAGDTISLAYQPKAMRWRGIERCSPTRRRAARSAHRAACRGRRSWSRSSPRPLASSASIEVQIHKINAPAGKAEFGAANARGQRQLRHQRVRRRKRSTRAPRSSTGKRRRRRSGKRIGTKVRGSGVAVSAYSAGSVGFDGLLVIQSGWQGADPVRHRQPRHARGHRRAPRRR